MFRVPCHVAEVSVAVNILCDPALMSQATRRLVVPTDPKPPIFESANSLEAE
jgi:hypothetical protein